MEAWGTRGDVVRWWRADVLGWSQQQTAQALSVGPSALSNWEHGTRDISIEFDHLDRVMNGGGVLAGLLWAFGTTRGMRPGRVWTKVFPGPSTPVWMWVRSDTPSIRVEGEWGVVRLETEVDLGPNGLLVTVGGSVPDSPVVVQLSAPGWADFGRGTLPEQVPGAQILPALDVVRPSTATGVFMDLFTADVASRVSSGPTPGPERHAVGSSSAPIASFASFASVFTRGRARSRVSAGSWPPLPEGTANPDRAAFAELRKARGLSLIQTADRVARVAGLATSKDTLRRFENDQGEPHHQLLPVALDSVLGAEGHLALKEIRSDRGSGTVTFPSYWHAPVWLAFDGSGRKVDIELQWANWGRRVQGELPLLVVSHYADPSVPLRIIASRRVRWTAGVGRPSDAVPINHGWVPISVEAARRALSDTRSALLDAIRRRSPPPGPET